jgi:RNA polymerase sigma factor (sigma-70 family)
LHDEHAAEDAFQGTFLVLARKAGVVYRQASLAGWLYQVAYRIALKAQAQARKRTTQGPEPLDRLTDRSAGDPADTLARRELQPLLYAEVNRLPQKYRDPVVLCYLQGQTNEEAAEQLGSPIGTVSGRLARARDLLRKRLTARGLALPGGLLFASLPESSALAAVPASLIVSTTQAALRFAAAKTVSALASTKAAALAEGVLKAMLVKKLKVVALGVLVLTLLGLGGGAMSQVGPFISEGQGSQAALEKQAPPNASARKRLVKIASPIEGVLLVIGRELKVKKLPQGPMVEELPAEQVVTVRIGNGDKKKYRRHREGDRVEEGELLAKLDDRLALNELAVQKAKLTAAQAEYEAAIATKKEAQRRLDRMDALRVEAGRKGAIVSAEDYAAGVLTRDRYKAEEISKKAGLEVAKLDVERAEINLDNHRIRSPARGVITAIYKDRGEAVQRLEPVVQIEILAGR